MAVLRCRPLPLAAALLGVPRVPLGLPAGGGAGHSRAGQPGAPDDHSGGGS